MPSKTEGTKGRSKEDTWGAPELTSQLQDATANRERRSKDKVKHRDGDERKHRSKEKPDDEKRSRDKREKSSRDKTAEDGKHRRDERGGKERSSRDDRHKDRETKEKHRDPDDNRDRERRKESDEKEKRRSGRHREKDGRDGGERKERSNKDEERRERKSDKDRNGDDRDDRHKERRDRREDRQKDGDDHDKGSRDRHREKRDKDGKRHKEKDGRSEKDHREEKGKTTKDEERRKRHKEKDSERRNHEKEKRRPHKTGKEDGESSAQDKLQRDEEYEEERRKRKEEKRRERKQREEEERMTVDKTEIKGSSEAEVPEGTPVTGANGYDYDDDFEDYEDDFEDEGDDAEDGSRTETDIDDSTLAELRQAMEAENRASSLSGRDTGFSIGQSSRGSTRPTTSTRKTFINFVAAKQRQISNSVAERTKKRGQELMKLIELDMVSFDLFDMPPVKDYERFIQHFGRSDTTQAIVQCNDDNLERDTQTEEIENCDKWCQHPAEGVQCCGGEGETSDDEFDLNVNQEASSLKLTQFLEAASQLMVVLLEESRAEHDGGALQSNQRSIVFSEGYTQLKPGLPFLKNPPASRNSTRSLIGLSKPQADRTRSILQVHVHPIQTHLLLALYGDMKVPVDKSPLCNRGLVCVWNINDPSQPQKILSCRSQPKCCSWSPMKATMVFAGTVDGSLVIWDLREPSNMHCHHVVDGTSWLVRVPTFCTDGILTEESHNSSVVAILPIVTAEDNLRASMPQEPQIGSDTSFQLASLEETGVIYFWVVLEIAKTSQAGSESELGLVPGGRVKLIWSSSISLNTPTRFPSITSNFKTICVQLNPQDPNQFYIGTDRGFVLHASRHHENVYPKIFRASYDVLVEVTHLDFSPFALSCFLVACADGTIRLHSTMYELPLLSWPNSTMGMEVTSIAWSHSRPSVFYTADSTSKVYVWSLLERDANPVKTEQFDNGRLTSLSVSNDYSASSMGRPGRRPELVIGNEKGCLEVHRLNERFSNASGDELDSMSVLLQSFV